MYLGIKRGGGGCRLIAMNRLGSILTKQNVITGLLVFMLVPWLRGAREPVGMVLIFGAVAVAFFLLWRQPIKLRFNWSVAHTSGLLLVAWSALSLIWSVNRFQSVSWLVTLVMAMGVYLTAYLAFQQEDIRQKWLSGFVWMAAGVSLVGVIIFLAQDYERLTSLFYWANPMAAFGLPAILLGLRQVLSNFSWPRAMATGMVLVAFWLTDSRTAIVTMALTAVLGIASYRLRKPDWTKIVLIMSISLVMAFGLGIIKRQMQGRSVTVVPGARFEEALKGESQSGSDRLNYLKSSWDIWLDNPLIGTGAGTFATVHPRYQKSVVSAVSDPHNFYVKTLVELGMVGLVLLLIFVTGLLVAAFKAWWRGGLPAAVGLSLAALLVHIALDIDLSFPVLVALLMQLAAWAPAVRAKSPLTAKAIVALPLGIMAAGLLVIGWYLPHQKADFGGRAQANNDYLQAAEFYASSHSGVIYNPDWLTREGINYYTYALSSKQKSEYLDLAQQLASEASNLDSLDAQHRFLLARIHRARGKQADAISEYEKAISMDSLNQPEYYLDLAHYLYIKGQIKRSLDLSNHALVLYSDSVVLNRNADQTLPSQVSALYLLRGQVYMSLGNLAAAEADFAKALIVDKNNSAARKQLRILN